MAKEENYNSISGPLLPVHSNDEESDHQHDYRNGSFGGSVFSVSTTIIGAGIMSLPATMRVLGLIPGTIVLILTAALAGKSVDLLLRLSRAAKARSYGAVMRRAFGSPGGVIAQIAVVVNNFGMVVVYMIIIGDVFSGTISNGSHHPGLLEEWFGLHWWTARTFVLLASMLIVVAPLALFKHVDSLRYASAVSIALAVVFVIVTAAIAIFKLVNGSISVPRLFPNLTDHASVWKLFTVVPVVVTAYVCHYNVHTIANELRYESQMQNVVRTSLSLCTAIYLATGIFNYLLFGNSTLDDVLGNYNTDLGIPYSPLFNGIVRISYVAHLMLVLPIVFHALRLNVDGLFFSSAKHLYSDKLRFSLLTIALLASTFLAANFIPSIWDAFQFTGATATVCIGFIFPAALTLREHDGIATRWEKYLSVIMIVLAVFSNAMAIYSDADSLIHKRNE